MWKCRTCGAQNWDSAGICHKCDPVRYVAEVRSLGTSSRFQKLESYYGNDAIEVIQGIAGLLVHPNEFLERLTYYLTEDPEYAFKDYDFQRLYGYFLEIVEPPEPSQRAPRPIDDSVPVNAEWGVSFDDLDSEYWEWFFNRPFATHIDVETDDLPVEPVKTEL